jgi:prepilin-type N-terminal cleavage/methylation domain-containing protein
MQYRIDREGRGGFTLIEIMIALAIVGIVVVIAASNFQGMLEKYRVEGETKKMFADLMDARARAMQRNRVFFVRVTGNGYSTYEDAFTNSAPDGDGIFTDGVETLVANETVTHPINTDNIAGVPLIFNFNRNGIASVTGFIRYESNVQPDYDCITMKATRIKMGQHNKGTNDCVEK